MSNHLDELKGLVATLEADRAAQKEKEKRDAWTKYVSLSMIFLAVLAAISTQRGAGYSTATMKQLNEATFNLAEASDQWAFFQAKGIKQSIYEQERDRLNTMGNPDPKVLASVVARIERYEKEKRRSRSRPKSMRRNGMRPASPRPRRPTAPGKWGSPSPSSKSPSRSAV
ncbi:MAG: DUF4337 family protein [Opitutus sp.]|nr:DUF4337 family protein [Opitutus sp.]